ncbi:MULTISPECIES: acetyl-CoA carboxylase biotin carboxyl carrier protein subunit [unclassified Lysinibacillus]|uniref:acetyl-CoA carboxylase biotin carboxyl carrier protein subunit n=1 Tax=unclassified Lysinibacillus TaxID=2636778 RepID=UPI002554037F|nr:MULTISPECIES: acetyl-CoA carboxylase biotin carboxyl carrier protein subunit [unclassified Lysinibacillus]MDM5248749.1 acetyl-CoA carboxylase biotin carboxyl carrier protein subunit [Lysinibacillus sp. G4S2]
MEIVSPMSGSVWKIEVCEGNTVSIGDVLIILESMKMEIPIEATETGVVKKIKVAEGDFVQEQEVVILLGN